MNSEDVEKVSLVIIESLPESDKKTGYNLFLSTIKYKIFQESNLSSEYYDIENRTDFFDLLNTLITNAETKNHFYILHFEIHGFEGGVNLKNNDRIFWKELMPLFRRLNIHYKNTLTIYLAVCVGASLVSSINPTKRSPFKVLISSEKNILENDIICGFEEFYNHFFFSFNSHESLEKYNSVISNPDDKLILVTSEYCFDTISDIERESIDKEKVMSIYRNHLLKVYPDVKYFPENYTNKYIEIKLKEMFDELKLKRDYFLMNDLKK